MNNKKLELFLKTQEGKKMLLETYNKSLEKKNKKSFFKKFLDKFKK